MSRSSTDTPTPAALSFRAMEITAQPELSRQPSALFREYAWTRQHTAWPQCPCKATGITASVKPTKTKLDFLIGLYVPAHFSGRLSGAIRILLLVLDVELGEVQRDVLGDKLSAMPSLLDAAHENVREFDLQVL